MTENIQLQKPVDQMIINITVNGSPHRLLIEPEWTLVYVLRNVLGLMGVKENCDEGACGFCTVLVEGIPTLSCMTLAAAMDGKNILTVEGLAQDGNLHPVQAAWVEEHGAQCGYCTPGFIMATVALLEKNPEPTVREIKDALEGNICRCGNYESIISSVQLASGIITGKEQMRFALSDNKADTDAAIAFTGVFQDDQCDSNE